jgi:putative CocE/NonD family hydrolase
VSSPSNSYQQRLAAWQKARFAPPPDPDPTPRAPSLIARTPMRDGIELYTEVYLSQAQGSFPVILIRSPYPMFRPSRTDQWPISRYLEKGYAFVFQLVRGQGFSGGRFRRYMHEMDDGFDCIEWLARQPWCNGKVGMEGSSYSGATQLLAARAKPAALKCIAPTAFVGNSITCHPYKGGVSPRGMLMQWFKVADVERWEDLDAPYGDMSVLKHPVWGPALRKRPLVDAADSILSQDKLDNWKEIVCHPLDDEFWRDVHFTDRDLAELELPMLITDGWYDLTIGPIDYFQRLERLRPGRADRYLLVGPWDHGQTYRAHLHHLSHGERPMPANGGKDLIAQRLAFFDRYLKGDASAVVQEQRVEVFITGADRWVQFETFPPPAVENRALYLRSQGDARSFPGDGQLSWEKPGQEPADAYVYDPDVPTPAEAEPIRDRREIEIRSDVLTYTTQPLTEPLTLLGDIDLLLYAASSARDTDWFATLTEVYPDGRSVAFHGPIGALRARYREGFDREVFLIENQAAEFRIPLGPAGHRIDAGNRLRLSIFSSCFPTYDANTNTGNRAATDTERQAARQRIYHDAARPSHLILPVARGL